MDTEQIISDEAHNQGALKNCYAHAVATIINAAQRRKGVEVIQDHQEYVKSLTEDHDKNGASTVKVLAKECFDNDLKCIPVKGGKCESILKKKRAVVATFELEET